MNKKILITGGAGYIGSIATKSFLDQNFEVVVLDSLENGHREAVDSRAKLEVFNISEREKLTNLIKEEKFLAVIDFAAYLAAGESMENPQKYIENNVENFIILLDAMSESHCRHIIKSSTAATYGNPEAKFFPLKEDYQDRINFKNSALLSGKWEREELEGEAFLAKIIDYYQEKYRNRPELLLSAEEIARLRIPASVYGVTKLLDEILLKKYEKFSGIKSVVLRYFNVCGALPDGSLGENKPNPTTLMTLCFWNILGKTGKLSVFGNDYPTKDGTGVRDYIHPLDLASGHIAALNRLIQNDRSETLNLGTGQGYSVLEVIEAVEKATGMKISYEMKGRRTGDPAISYSDPTKAKEVLNWEAKYNLTDMANTAWQWHKKERTTKKY